MKKKILLVDDDQDFGLLVSRFLDQNGYETQLATNGETALRKLNNSDFDAILCDFRLGDMNGKDFLMKLNELELYPILIFITAYANARLFSEMLQLGAYEFLSKPVIPSEILAVLAGAFENSSSINPVINRLVAKQREDNILFSNNGFAL